MDVIFMRAHYVPYGGLITQRRTSFGGLMTFVCLWSIFFGGVLLGVDTLLNPPFSTAISTQPETWPISGTFRVTVEVHGFGIVTDDGKCQLTIGIDQTTSNRVDWLSATNQITNQSKSNAVDGSCVVEWTCASCSFQATAKSKIVVNSTGRSWATHVYYQIETPAFTKDKDQSGNDRTDLFRVEGTIVAPSHHGFSSSLAPGGDSIVAVLLTPLNVTNGFNNSQIAFQPAVSSIQIGDSVGPKNENINFASTDAFQMSFSFQRNSFTILYQANPATTFTIAVLAASLCSTVISVMGAVLGSIERILGIDSVYGAPRLPSDTIRHWTETDMFKLQLATERNSHTLESSEERLEASEARLRDVERLLCDLLPGAADRLAAQQLSRPIRRKLLSADLDGGNVQEIELPEVRLMKDTWQSDSAYVALPDDDTVTKQSNTGTRARGRTQTQPIGE